VDTPFDDPKAINLYSKLRTENSTKLKFRQESLWLADRRMIMQPMANTLGLATLELNWAKCWGKWQGHWHGHQQFLTATCKLQLIPDSSAWPAKEEMHRKKNRQKSQVF